MNRKEAIVLLGELGANQLVNPNLVLIDEITLGNYQIKIKGTYDLPQIVVFLKNKFSFEERKDHFIIFNQ